MDCLVKSFSQAKAKRRRHLLNGFIIARTGVKNIAEKASEKDMSLKAKGGSSCVRTYVDNDLTLMILILVPRRPDWIGPQTTIILYKRIDLRQMHGGKKLNYGEDDLQ